jgi:multidrug efflux system membrane fusion protein
VQDSQNGQMVFVAREDSTVEERKIVTGARIGENIVVEKGLRDGEQVVTTGQLRLVNGAKYVLAKSASNNAARPMTSSTQ